MEVDTFTAERRKKVEDAYEALTGIVKRALEAENYDALIAEVLALWTEVRDGDDPEREGIFESILTDSLTQTSYTEPDTDARAAQVTRMALWLASFAVNDATDARLDAEGLGKEWVTMHDDKVRATHREVDGTTASLAGTFMVGGTAMHYPGEPVGDPDLWMGCRCVLRPATRTIVAATDVEEVTESEMEADMADLDFQPVPWHGVLAPLGVMSGDRRLFDAEAEVTTRDLPIPMKYMKKDKSGHEDSVVVANITKVWVEGGLILGEGFFADTEEAAEAIAMRAQDMMRGVSVDLDNTTTEFRDEDGNPVDVFDLSPDDPDPIMAVTKLRIAAATICAIPAFQEAYYDLGTWEDEFAMQDCEDCADDGPDRLEDQDEEEDDRSKGAVAVLVPADGDPIARASSEPAHMTLAYFGEAKDLSTEDIAALLTTVSAYASQIDGPVTAAVGERTTLGDEDADVVMLDGDGIHGLRSGLVEDETVAEVMSRVEQYENWTPHVTLGYPETPANEDYEGETVTFDRIALWIGDERTEFMLGEEAVVAGAFPYGNGEKFRDYSPEERDAMAKDGRAMPDGSFPIADEEDLRNAIQAIGRAKDPEAAKKHITKRAKALGKSDLIPETWALAAALDREFAVPPGTFKVTETVSTTFNVATFAPGTKDGPGWITDPIPTSRIRRYWVHGEGAAKIRWMVPGDFNRCRKQLAKYIRNPAWLAGTCANLHKEATGFWPGGESGRNRHSSATLAIGAAGLVASAAPALEGSRVESVGTGKVVAVAADGSRRQAPAKILGAGNRLQVVRPDAGPITAKVVKVQTFGDGAVFTLVGEDVRAGSGPSPVAVAVSTSSPDEAFALRDDEVVELWLGSEFRRSGGEEASVVAFAEALAETTADTLARGGLAAGGYTGHIYNYTPQAPQGGVMAPAYTEVEALTAAAAPLKAQWFADPQLSGPTPLTITDDGRVYGHVAAWGTCHIGSRGKCIEVPTSASNYAYFNVGAVSTDEGLVSVGHITMETGHADLSLSATATMAHYDNTAMVVADVKAGEDVFGVWIAGALRDGVTDADRHALQAAALSGDWRSIGGSLEMVAALAVNVPGFPIPRTAVAASGSVDLALVAAGMVMDDEDQEVSQADVIGEIVRTAITEYRAQEKAMESLPALRAHFKPPLAVVEDIETVRNFFEEGSRV